MTSKLQEVSHIDVSFAIACYNAGDFLEAAVASALAQTDVSVEVIIVDDGSDDGSYQRAEKMAAKDSRIQVLKTPKNLGPGGARNLALAAMQGDWYAVLDSDDLLKPERTRMLIDMANSCDADLIADDLEVFGDGVETYSLMGGAKNTRPVQLDLDLYFERSRLFAARPGYGFLKPMIRRSLIEEKALRYDERLRIGEDDELIVRLLIDEFRYFLTHHAMYRYRKHGNSISHRLSVVNAEKMLETERNIQKRVGPEIMSSSAYRRRLSSVKRGLAFVTSVDHLKKRRYFAAILTVLKQPAALILYKMPIRAALNRLTSSG